MHFNYAFSFILYNFFILKCFSEHAFSTIYNLPLNSVNMSIFSLLKDCPDFYIMSISFSNMIIIFLINKIYMPYLLASIFSVVYLCTKSVTDLFHMFNHWGDSYVWTSLGCKYLAILFSHALSGVSKLSVYANIYDMFLFHIELYICG